MWGEVGYRRAVGRGGVVECGDSPQGGQERGSVVVTWLTARNMSKQSSSLTSGHRVTTEFAKEG
jgi:hypothetical protein